MALDHIMIDIETLGTKPGSVIASIGAVRFDPRAGVQGSKELKEHSFKTIIDVCKAIDDGMTVDGFTLIWWMNQSDEARNATFIQKGLKDTPWQAMEGLGQFLKPGFLQGVTSDYIWGNGANFDMVLIEAMCYKYGYTVPWKYSKIRCLRTLKETVNYDGDLVPGNLLAHDCLADAVVQAQTVQAIVQCNPGLKL